MHTYIETIQASRQTGIERERKNKRDNRIKNCSTKSHSQKETLFKK